jgi:hypothetical protein
MDSDSAHNRSAVDSNPEQHAEYQSFATTIERIENFREHLTDAGKTFNGAISD